MKGMTTCKVCGKEFPLMAEDHYIVQDPRKIGTIANLVNTDKAIEYDAFDCPHCGCQNVMQTRKPIWLPEVCECKEEITEESEEKIEEKTDPEKSIADMREFLIGYCDGRLCINCPLDKKGFICGRGYSFKSDPEAYVYMDDDEIERHYKAVKEAENE